MIPERPLDILAQQIVAMVAAEEWDEDALFERVRGAWPYRDLERKVFDDVVHMLSEGFSSRRGRRGAYLHRDGVNRRLKARRGARLALSRVDGILSSSAAGAEYQQRALELWTDLEMAEELEEIRQRVENSMNLLWTKIGEIDRTSI